MEQEFDKAKKLIEKSGHILLTMHERMDGDDGGAGLAVALHLEKIGKKITHAIKWGVPEQLRFLPRSHKILNDVPKDDYDLLITFGCHALDRTGIPTVQNLKVPIVNIDHHPDNTYFGDVNMVDSGQSSVAELVHGFFRHCNWQVDKDMATCLLTGIITDTGSFMHSNTKSSTLKSAAELMRRGARTNNIIHHTFKNKDLSVLRAWGRALENSYYDKKNRVIYSVITEKDLDEIGRIPKAAFDGVVEMLNTVPEAKFALFVRQEGGNIKGSLRSSTHKNVDVSAIAKLFGGGGHRLAAGFSVAGKLAKDDTGKWKVARD